MGWKQLSQNKYKKKQHRPNLMRNIYAKDAYCYQGETEIVNKFRTLGVTFSWPVLLDYRINHIVARHCSVVGLVSSNPYVLPNSVTLSFYTSFVISHVCYGYFIWRTTCKPNLKGAHTLQNTFLRLTGTYLTQHIGTGYLNNLALQAYMVHANINWVKKGKKE